MLKKNSKKLTWSPHAAVAFIFYTPTVKASSSQANIFHNERSVKAAHTHMHAHLHSSLYIN